MNKKYIFGFLFLIILVVLFKLGFYLGKNEGQPSEPFVQFFSDTEMTAPKKLSFFNPNQLDEQGWVNLGFSEKQSQVILYYKEKKLLGYFKNAEDLKNCFVISEEKFQEIKPFIQIKVRPEASPVKEVEKQTTDFSQVDLNQITKSQLLEFGFSEIEIRSFLGFRKILGGFVDKSQILETYHLN